MPLMGSLYIGASGLQTSQNSINTTAHNLSNTGTAGYVRQQVQTGTATYNTIKWSANSVSNQQVGLGVIYTRTRQVRDTFLDATYRKESGRSAFYEVSYDAINEVENLLDEMNGESFEESIQDLWSSIQELSKDPSSAVTQGLLVERCSEFLARAQSVYEGLVDYQNSLNTTVNSSVKRINEIADKIKTLNDEIRNIEITNVGTIGNSFERANDLRDERNRLLDELATYGNIAYTEDTDCTVWVQFEGEDLIRGEIAYKIGVYQDPTTGFYTPFWEKNAKYTTNDKGEKIYDEADIKNAQIFDLNRVIASDLNTDVGSLKSVLLARGDHRSDYTDLLDDGRYEYDISQSVCMNVMAEFDQLVHNIATKINDILAEAAKEAKDVNPASTYLLDENGNPIQIFTKIASDGYTGSTYNAEQPGSYDESTGEVTGKVSESLYSTMNLQINADLLKEPTKLSFTLIDGSIDNDTVTKLKQAFESEDSTLNPNVKKKSSFVDYYGDLVSQVANSGYVYKSICESQELTVSAAENAREEVIGVSQDEELTLMIKYQNAYNAASRYINVINQMLEHILNTLGS